MIFFFFFIFPTKQDLTFHANCLVKVTDLELSCYTVMLKVFNNLYVLNASMGLIGMSDTGLSKVNPQGNQFRISMLMFLYQKILKMKIS